MQKIYISPSINDTFSAKQAFAFLTDEADTNYPKAPL